MASAPTPMNRERRLSLLGIILLALHPLFGITAVIGMLISSTQLKSVKDTVYHSHLKWQIATFWMGCLAYVIAFILWKYFSLTWPPAVAFILIAYRVATNIKHWSNFEPLNRQL